jgi:hypothetical protein
MFNLFKRNDSHMKGELLPAGMKYTPNPLLEVELGDDDLMLIQTERTLSLAQREAMSASWKKAIEDKAAKVLVLDSGMTFSVVRRT